MKIYKVNCWFGAQSALIKVACKSEQQAIDFCMDKFKPNKIVDANIFSEHEYIIPEFVLNN